MSKRKNNNKVTNKKNLITITGLFAVAITLVIIYSIKNAPVNAELTKGGDLTIIKSDITNEMKLYPYQSNDAYMEVMAIKASDGTIRTALNTCISCYNSGRGYYTQQGDILICQNCGTKFEVDQIEVAQGGCNPVTIEKDAKTEDEEQIVINGDSFVQYEPLFEKWKK